ncbi:hypothetical protein ACQR10_07010 [Bradyrhizobium sp. HKCCYLRH2060]|uniref:hypothetical protein n=1 Tax=Bradyrhizobium TaxID=374 RepID=UPI002915FB4F|nr:hypothetical protein [Bradyrhizobium sp. SZCCHNR3003]
MRVQRYDTHEKLEERARAMNQQARLRTGRRGWRILLLPLLIMPFVPEIVVYAATVLGRSVGCRLDDSNEAACQVAGWQISSILDAALQAGLLVSVAFGIGFAAVWLAVCYYVVNRGWSQMASRVILISLLTMMFAGLPYLAPNLALAYVANQRCEANGGSCYVFGGKVTNTARDVVVVSDQPFIASLVKSPPGPIGIGAPIAGGMFVIYVVGMLASRIVLHRRKAATDGTGASSSKS